MRRSGLSPGRTASWCERPAAQFPDGSMSACAVKWSRRKQALAVEASRTVGDALMQLPRHCRVSPPAPTYNTNTTTHTYTHTHRPARSRHRSLISSPVEPARSRSPGNRGAVRESSWGFIYLCRATWDLSSTQISFFSPHGLLEVAWSNKVFLNATK